jgi:hypothetical protein
MFCKNGGGAGIWLKIKNISGNLWARSNLKIDFHNLYCDKSNAEIVSLYVTLVEESTNIYSKNGGGAGIFFCF